MTLALGMFTTLVGTSGRAGSAPVAAPVVTVAISPSSLTEGADFTVTASRTGANLTAASIVNYAITGTGTGNVSTALTGTITILANTPSRTLTVATIDDATDEADTSITVTITANTNCTIGTPSAATASILDNDAPEPLYAFLAHSSFVALGDSITSQKSSSRGMMNWVNRLLFKTGGRFRPRMGADQGIGGNTIANMLARVNNAVKQSPDVLFFMCGRNSLAASTLGQMQTDTTAILNAYFAERPDGKVIWAALLPSTSDAGATITLRNDYNTWRMTLDNRTGTNQIWAYDVPVGFNPATHTHDGVHANQLGAELVAAQIWTDISAQVEPATVLDEITAASYYGANLDTERALTGTGGTKTGTVAPTGNVATGKEVTNNTSVAPACDNQTVAGTQRIDISGTPSAEATVVFDEAASSNVTLSGVSGDVFEFLVGVKVSDVNGSSAPAGLRQLEYVAGVLGGMGFSLTDAGNVLQSSVVIDAVMRTWPTTVRAVTANVSPTLTWRTANVAQTDRVAITKAIARKTELLAYALPYYLGGDGIKTSTETFRITGTGVSGSNITAATVATLTMEPGTWSGGLITYTRAMRINGSTVSGAFATLWTYSAGGTLTAGQTVEFDVTATNSFGGVTRTLTFSVV